MLVLFLAPRRALALDPNLALAQYTRDTWGAKNGLSDEAVLSVLPTSDGHLWLGTQSGLVRFDGDHFAYFETGQLGLRQHSYGRELVETADGSVWAGLVGGVSRYSAGRFDFFAEQEGLAHPFVYALAPGPRGTLWVGTGGAGVWQLDQGAFKRHPAYAAVPDLPGKVNDLAVDKSGVLWVATDRGVVILGVALQVLTTADGLPSNVVNVIQIGRQNEVWVGTRGGLARLEGKRFVPYASDSGLQQVDVTAILEDHGGTLWIGTREGHLARLKGQRFDVDQASSEPTNGGVFSLAEDREGALWVGMGTGLQRLRQGPFVSAGREQGMTNQQILNVAPSRRGGLWVLDGAGALLRFAQGSARLVSPPGSVPGDGMLGMLETEDGSLWVGGQTLHRYLDGQWTSYEPLRGEVSVIVPEGPQLLVAQTAADGKSSLWHFSNGQFVPFLPELALVHVQRLYRDRLGRIWISSGGGGLVRIAAGATRTFRKRDGLPHDVVYGLTEDSDGNLWVATRGGLARIRGDQVVNLSAVEVLPRRSPMHVQKDGLGYLWVTADDGIFRIHLQGLNAFADGIDASLNTQKFTTADGLLSVAVSWRASGQAKTADGKLWYATARGLSSVDPALLESRAIAPKAYVEQLLAGGHLALFPEKAFLDEGRERLEIRFTAPSLVHADQLRFRYRLGGYEDGWVDAGSRRVAFYTNVPPGNYAFSVEARRLNGSWEDPGAVLHIQIEPHWYETTLAKLALGVALLLGLVGSYQFRVHKLKQHERELTEKVQARTEDLRLEVLERSHVEQEVRQLNEQLEQRVFQRTAQYETAIHALGEDIARRRRVEAALADEKERLAVTLRSIADGVVTTDVEGRIVLMNPVAGGLMGWATNEAVGLQLVEHFPILDRHTREPLRNPVTQVLGEEGEKIGILTQALLVNRLGRQVLLDVSAAPIHDRQSRIVGAVLVFRDVTERTRAEEQLQKSQKLEAVGLLAAGIAHDFNNLLTGIFGHVELARASLPEGALAGVWLHDVVDVLENARGLARQLLTFSSGGRPATEPHSIGELLRRSARFVLSGSNVASEVQAPKDLWPCDGDPLQLRQAIDNLVLNARQAMPGGGTIRITASNVELKAGEVGSLALGRYIQVRISDNGPGMSKEVQERIFDPFFSTKPSGSGIGLATVQSIVTQHEGSIDFESVEGKGTTFRLHLKAAAHAGALVPLLAQAESRAAKAPGSSGRVLTMDDEPLIRKITRVALVSAGYSVEVASHGREALERFERAQQENRPFDLVILDLTIAGGLGGAETLVELRKLDPNIRAIASSGYSSGPVLTNPKAYGFSGTLPKPFKLSDLTIAVDLALRAEPPEIRAWAQPSAWPSRWPPRPSGRPLD